MNPSPPSTAAEWREFLREHSAEFLNSDYLRRADEDGRAKWLVSDDQREAGWLGFEPAGEEAIRATEERLGIKLPPSYLRFLRTSNGWSSLAFAVDLHNTEAVGWFADVAPDLVEAWESAEMDDWVAVARRCLLIADDDGGSGNYWLLDSESIADNGEWTAYDWWPGDGEDPEPYADFAALVTAMRELAAGGADA